MSHIFKAFRKHASRLTRILLLAVTVLLPGTAAAALLENTLELPLITFNNQGVTSYDATANSFSVSNASPLAILVAGNPPATISGNRSFTIRATVDSLGVLTDGAPGHDLIVSGDVNVPGLGAISGELLTGEITGFGFRDATLTSDSFDFTFTVTGGQLASLYPQTVGVSMISELSNFAGNFGDNFSGAAKGTLGGILPSPALGDRVWEDLNANGVQDCTDGGVSGTADGIIGNAGDLGPECGTGIPGVVVNLFVPDGSGNCTTSLGISTQTDADGFYRFDLNSLNLGAGDYCVEFKKPANSFCSASDLAPFSPKFTVQNVGDDTFDSDADQATGRTSAVAIAPGETNLSVDAGIYCPTAVGDFVWLDDGDGIQQSTEQGVKDVIVELFSCGIDGLPGTNDPGEVSLGTRTTDANGMYTFSGQLFIGLSPGNYYVNFQKPSGFDFTLQNQGDDSLDSDANPATGNTGCIEVLSRQPDLTFDAGLVAQDNCGLVLDKTCRVEPQPTPSFDKCDGKLQQFTVTWTGAPITISGLANDAPGGAVGTNQEVTFFGPFASNDVFVTISGGVNGQSKFHMSCSDDDFNSPDDCGKLSGNGKDNASDFINAWRLEGFVDNSGQVLDCTVPVSGDGFANSCTFARQDPPSCNTLDGGKPRSISFKYTGGGCVESSNTQDTGKAVCTPTGGTVTGDVTIVAAGNESFTKDVYTVDPAFVSPNGTFEVTFNDNEFKSNSFVRITDGSGNTELNEFHTSCSQPLAVGDVFGSLTVAALDGQDGGVDVTYQYVVTNNGDPVSNIFVTDDPLGSIGGPIDLATGESSLPPFTRTARITGTTLNTGTATGTLASGSACTASDQVIVTEVIPPCVVSPGEFKLDDDRIKWKITNAGDKVVTVESIVLSAPDEFGAVKKVKLNGDIFKDDTRPMTFTFTNADFVNDLKDRQIKSGETKELVFETTEKFKQAMADQISITVNFVEDCSITFEAGLQPFVCSDAKPIDSLSMIWNGPETVTVSAAGQTVVDVVKGQEVSFSGLSGLGNDVVWNITGAVNGVSTFHVSCSDSAMNGPEDCGLPLGDGKSDDKGLNLWLFEGMAGTNGVGLNCSALP